MQVQTFTVDASYDGAPGLKMLANQYRPTGNSHNSAGDLVLIFAHATGMPKEVWEPTIASVFNTASARAIPIREAWSVEWPSHGESAVINEQVLSKLGQGVSVKEWGGPISTLLRTHIPSECHVIGVSHSAGGTALLFSSLPALGAPIILCEPVMISPGCFEEHKEERTGALELFAKFTTARKSVWPSRAEARKYLQSRIPWKLWDSAVLDLFVEHGLRPVGDGDKVTLKCNKQHEAVAFLDMQPHIDASVKLDEVRETIPVHLIFGQRDDAMPRYAHDSIFTGKKTDSVQWIPGAGHPLVQEVPSKLALAIVNVLSLEVSKKPKAKL